MENAMKTVVQTSSFYTCRTKKQMSAKTVTRSSVLYGILNQLGDRLSDGRVQLLYDSIRKGYQEVGFQYDYVRDMQIADDIACLKRFISFLDGYKILSTKKSLTVETSHFKFLSYVNLIAEKDGQSYACIVFPKKADKSLNGKSIHTNSETDLNVMCAKASLEKDYPGINIALVYLFNEDDALGNPTQFRVLKTKKSNIFIHDYSSYYDEHGFSFETLYSQLEKAAMTKVSYNCFECDCRDFCQKNTISNMPKANAKDETDAIGYQMPTFTETQQKVINKIDGPLLVCAGPGSGKTATLVGRIKHLLDCGIEPEFILAITFTREAAQELKNRCLSFCKPYSVPEIMTLNALGYQILKLNPSLVGNIKLLTSREKMTLIDRLLDISEPLEGFNYSVIKGNNGLLHNISKALDDVLVNGNTEKYAEDFLRFSKLYESVVKQNGYISYSEQITLAQKLFNEHPDVLDKISSRYKYIMVDEYQDIDRDQAKFIYSLSLKSKNICAVGDDDQSIYAFRGGSNRYMLDFRKIYPDAELYTLKENFRTSEKIVRSAEKVILGNKRINKEIIPVKKGGLEPVAITGQSASELNMVVSELISKGYAYEDIAVIASKNQTLCDLQREVSFPSILGKEYVVNNPFFKVLSFALKNHYEQGCDYSAQIRNLIADDKLAECVLSVSIEQPSAYYCDEVSSVLNLSESAIKQAVERLIYENHARSTKELYELLQYMADFGDETRVEPDTKGSVIFITSHESKGMEWRVVLMVDDYKDDSSEEQNRLIYVAMTRAKDALYIFERDGKRLLAA
ncbi:ATP-dependent helicase [Butyrivibrio hungatei]|uniref:ATP-dependent DNA helicase UvrD/REP family n=1 Tax=Butyrivibrio hungatei TaxID=185008 RepID=A0A1D9P5U7_9FIRM|nr:ATP-dependent helicase [Butyrivibrio hungatei]AOZ97862.1 ATP-dependent DNA helicase UvrD/REP family [Butyrivibrio hungatei]